jgi:hypothetical protein
MLVLFVAIFSVIMAMGAFAVDQGLAYGRHGLAQSNADTAARAGAYGCVESMSEGASVSSACNLDAEDAAEKNAIANLVDPNDLTTDGDNECLGVGNNDFPSMAAEVDKTSPSLFGGLLGIGEYTAKSRATACVGAVSGLRDGDTPLIPVWFSDTRNSHDQNDDYCGDPPDQLATSAGEPCVIFSTHGGSLDSAGLFTRGSGNTTCGPTNDQGVVDGLAGGLTGYQCAVNQQLHDEGVSDDAVLDAFQARLDGADDCTGGSSNSQTAFGETMLGIGDEVADGPDFVFRDDSGSGPGDDDQDTTIYKKQSCDSPRLVLVPLVNSTSSSTKQIVGFTAIYILGCYRDDDGRDATTTMNECHSSDRGANDGGPCQHFDHGHCTDNSDTEVRAGIVRMYLAGDSVTTIGRFGTGSSNGWIGDNSGISIQTRQ